MYSCQLITPRHQSFASLDLHWNVLKDEKAEFWAILQLPVQFFIHTEIFNEIWGLFKIWLLMTGSEKDEANTSQPLYKTSVGIQILIHIG